MNARTAGIAAVALAVMALLLQAVHGEGITGRNAKADALASVMILDNGRLKPLDSYARSMLTQLSGRPALHGTNPVQWLARVIFTPLAAADDKVFVINNPEVADALGITPEKHRRYSFNELKRGYHKLMGMARAAETKEARERTQFENEMVRVARNLQDYLQLSSVLMCFTPYQEFSVADSSARIFLGLAPDTAGLSYYNLTFCSDKIALAAAEAERKNRNTWTVFDMTMMALDKAVDRWAKSRGDQPFHVIPRIVGGRAEWDCPWIVMLDAGGRASSPTELRSLDSMRSAFVSGDDRGFAAAAASFRSAAAQTTRLPSPAVELLYNRINPFTKAKILYGLAALLALVLLTISSRRWVYALTIALVCAALVPHTFGLVARVVILHRPPLATIYETFLFVAWACVGIGLVLESVQQKSLGLLISSLCGFFFLHVAGKYNIGEDSMGMIAAVLNSNFWLTTHIMSITLGYAGCCCAGIIGHVYLVKKLFLKTPEDALASTAGSLYGILAFGLTFTLVGTMLGGMWADQSWGRFWGWDPKENGALFIILWCAVVFHARLAGIVRDTGTAVGAVISLVLVMFAWIGVNLLGIGMHSYGFTTTGITLLYSFLICESIFLAGAAAAFLVTKTHVSGRRGTQG
jgi:ABC-type transport system involved in cytochrome c biogenesis permease subunit